MLFSSPRILLTWYLNGLYVHSRMNDLTPLELYPLALENLVGLITYKEAKRYSI